MTNLSVTCARQRMIRGETQYNKVSRFVKEIPVSLLGGMVRKKETDSALGGTQEKSFRQAASRVNPVFSTRNKYQTNPYQSTSFSSSSTGKITLEYTSGDRVKHVKFGEGTVTNIVEGGRDYEITVDFDRVGTKKMFASFAKLKKV